jgi:hypothetical protein
VYHVSVFLLLGEGEVSEIEVVFLMTYLYILLIALVGPFFE